MKPPLEHPLRIVATNTLRLAPWGTDLCPEAPGLKSLFVRPRGFCCVFESERLAQGCELV